MPTFSFSSQGGTSLSDRIAMINARQKAKMAAVQDEEVAEEALMQQVVCEEEKKQHEPIGIPSTEPAVLSKAVHTRSELLDTLAELTKKVDDLAELTKKVDDLALDVKKMNKHINSIVKTLKKA